MKLQDKSTHTQFTTDDRGYLTTTAKLARIGAMQYLGEEIGKTPNKVYDVYVEAEDLFSPETIKSFENTPVTIEHPEEMFVDSSNWHELAVGHITNIRPDSSNEYLLGDVVINSPKAIEVIRDGKIEVSCGYDAELIDANGKIKKANIKGNHLAIVDEGRCGDKCKLGDGKPTMKKTLKDSLVGLFSKKQPARTKKTTLADAKKRLGDAQGEYKQKLADLAEVVGSDAPVEEKASAVEELSVEVQAASEEITAVIEEIAALAVDIQADAPEETTANDEMTAEEESMVADLEAQLQEKDDKIAELEAELEKLKEAEAKTTVANDIKRVFGDSVAITSKMSSVDMMRAAVVSTGGYNKDSVKKLADCSLNSAFAAAITVGAKTHKIGAKLLGDSKPVEKQLPKALRGAK